MLAPRSRCRDGVGPAILAMRYLALVGLLSACATETTSQVASTTAARGGAQEASECSFLGRAACRAMALGSDSQGICTVARSGGSRVEICGTAATTVAAAGPAPPAKPQAAPANLGITSRSSVRLSWQDNSTDETGFVIERCDQIDKDPGKPKLTASCRGTWNMVGNVDANTTIYVDHTVIANQTYIYRVKATNQSGSSAYTAEAVITAPVK